VCIDLALAFNTVNHEILLYKNYRVCRLSRLLCEKLFEKNDGNVRLLTNFTRNFDATRDFT